LTSRRQVASTKIQLALVGVLNRIESQPSNQNAAIDFITPVGETFDTMMSDVSHLEHETIKEHLRRLYN